MKHNQSHCCSNIDHNSVLCQSHVKPTRIDNLDLLDLLGQYLPFHSFYEVLIFSLKVFPGKKTAFTLTKDCLCFQHSIFSDALSTYLSLFNSNTLSLNCVVWVMIFFSKNLSLMLTKLPIILVCGHSVPPSGVLPRLNIVELSKLSSSSAFVLTSPMTFSNLMVSGV